MRYRQMQIKIMLHNTQDINQLQYNSMYLPISTFFSIQVKYPETTKNNKIESFS